MPGRSRPPVPPPGADLLLGHLSRLGSDAMLLLDPARNVVWASANVGRILAPAGDDGPPPPPVAAGLPLAHLLDDPHAAELVGEAAAEHRIARGELRHSAWRRVLRAAAAPVELGGQPPMVLLILADITHERRLSRAHQDLIANLSHDLRTPLAGLRLMAETLTGEARGDAAATQLFATRIAAEALRLQELVAGILDLGRLEAGAERAQISEVDLQEVAGEAVEALRPQARQRGLELVMEGAATPARADRPRLSRALANVLDNALKFTEPPGSVTVKVKERSRGPTISVRDTGSGISPSQLSRIFDRFYTGDRSRSDRSSGLGLTIAKQAVELQGGRIEIRSSPGKGTVVRIVLPRP
ncbi:MAG: sensor histidine kinase [Candidatus Dormibacteria bacterium]